MRCCSAISRWFNRLGSRYVLLIAKNPAKVAIAYFLMSTILTGFETRGTKMANERLTLAILSGKILSSQQLLLYNQENFKHNEGRNKREIASGNELPSSEIGPTESSLNFTINYDDYGQEEALTVDEITSGCAQYFALGKYYPKNAIDLLSKAIFRIESFDEAFSLNVMRKLCELDDIIEETSHRTQVTAFKAALPYSFNLPHYTMCLNSTFTTKCEHLNEKDLKRFKQEILKCADEDSELKGGLCNTTIAQQLRYFIIEKGAKPNSKPLYIGAILRVQLYPGSSAKAIYFTTLSLKNYTTFIRRAQKSNSKGFLNMNFKEHLFMENLIKDCLLSVLAILLVVLVAVIAHSFWFSITLVIGMLLSIGVAFFVYVNAFKIVLQIKFFPFINLLAVLIAIAISFDNGFLLAFQYKKSIKSARFGLREDAFESHFLADTDSQRFALKEALAHAGFSMFVADFTTIISFLTNCSSNIIVLKCFGVFAALTIATNFLFAISGMPALIMLIEARCQNKRCSSFMPLKWTRCMKSAGETLKNFNVFTLPRLVSRFKLIVLSVAGILFAFSIYSMVIYPGIRLPDNNPMQLLRSSHIFEWFDENEMRLFDFSHYRIRQMNFYAIWGVSTAKGSSNFDPSIYGSITYDKMFKIDSIKKLERFEQTLQMIRQSDAVQPSQRNSPKMWLTELVDYVHASNTTCGNPKQHIQSNEFDFNACAKEFARKTPVFGFPDDFSMDLKDGPLFDAKTEKLIGYFMLVPSRHRLLLVYSKIQPFIHDINELHANVCRISSDSEFNIPCPIFVPSEFLSRMADLLSILLNSTTLSTLICVGISMIVIFGTTRHFVLSICVVLGIAIAICIIISIILWLGWYINVVEATIIIITIGLSFDYTLHMAVAFKASPLHLNAVERMTHASGEVHTPIFLAALTNAVGGVVLIWSKTQPFYEIGVFLMTMAFISYIAAILLFPAFVFCFYGFKKLKQCD
ncbi:SSD domain-containing protein [Aphelenchoides bicaudatus]|nr:SSD domain-containing protein [Aphelenchoides bicaudatus]